jgi:hypothetical protein
MGSEGHEKDTYLSPRTWRRSRREQQKLLFKFQCRFFCAAGHIGFSSVAKRPSVRPFVRSSHPVPLERHVIQEVVIIRKFPLGKTITRKLLILSISKILQGKLKYSGRTARDKNDS